nr:MAG TPA: hypothetical protein [Caudoviricetes sp.]
MIDLPIIKTFLNESCDKIIRKKREKFDKLRNLSKRIGEKGVILAKN